IRPDLVSRAGCAMPHPFALRSDRRSSRASRARRRTHQLRGELLERREVLAADISFSTATHVLTINVTGAGETVTLSSFGSVVRVASTVGTTADATAQSVLGFAPSTGANVLNSGTVLATASDVRRIEINGAAGTQTLNISGGFYPALTVVDGAEDVETVA